MRLKKLQNGGRPGGDPVQDYLDRVDPNRLGMSVESTFGPMDYVMGAFPLGRVLSPAAKAVGKYLGLGRKATSSVSSPAQKAMNEKVARLVNQSSRVERQGMGRPKYIEQMIGDPDLLLNLRRISDLGSKATSTAEKKSILKDFNVDVKGMSDKAVERAASDYINDLNKMEFGLDDFFRDYPSSMKSMQRPLSKGQIERRGGSIDMNYDPFEMSGPAYNDYVQDASKFALESLKKGSTPAPGSAEFRMAKYLEQEGFGKPGSTAVQKLINDASMGNRPASNVISEAIEKGFFSPRPTPRQLMSPTFTNENGGRIGKKIKVLKKEGRPHDQAVAIALSMRDRGEL